VKNHMKPVAILAAALLLTGCASVQQAVQAYGSVAVTGARAANDTIIEAQKVSLCGLPWSAIARHPEIVPAVRSLCLAPGDKTGAELLEAATNQPAAKS
jgi:starvation-inducible outer membrane lipoprotein